MTAIQETMEAASETIELLTVEEAADRMVEGIIENYVKFKEGERDHFQVDFPLNLAGHDPETGEANGVHDIAHKAFLEIVGVSEAGEGFIATADGQKLYVREVQIAENEPPIHICYSADAIY